MIYLFILQNVYSYSSTQGLTITGSCVASGACTSSTITIGSNSATGTMCCYNQGCNGPVPVISSMGVSAQMVSHWTTLTIMGMFVCYSAHLANGV